MVGVSVRLSPGRLGQNSMRSTMAKQSLPSGGGWRTLSIRGHVAANKLDSNNNSGSSARRRLIGDGDDTGYVVNEVASSSRFDRQLTPIDIRRAIRAGLRSTSANSRLPKNVDDLSDELIQVKRELRSLSQENIELKTQLRRMEETKSKMMTRLHPSPDSLPSLANIQRYSNREVVAPSTSNDSLMMKLQKMEQLLLEKDRTINDMKYTTMVECRIQTETLYQEVFRLQHKIRQMEEHDSTVLPRELSGKIKSLNDTITRLNDANARLKLKQQHRQQVTSTTMGSGSRGRMLNNGRRVITDDNHPNVSRWSRAKLVKNVVDLQRLVDKNQTTAKSQNNGGVHLDKLKAENDRLLREIKSMKRDRERIDRKSESPLNGRRQTRIQSSSSPPHQSLERTTNEKVELFKRNRAAKVIQRHWRRHLSVKEATEVLVAAVRGHLARLNGDAKQNSPHSSKGGTNGHRGDTNEEATVYSHTESSRDSVLS